MFNFTETLSSAIQNPLSLFNNPPPLPDAFGVGPNYDWSRQNTVRPRPAPGSDNVTPPPVHSASPAPSSTSSLLRVPRLLGSSQVRSHPYRRTETRERPTLRSVITNPMHNWASPTPSLSDIRTTIPSVSERTATPRPLSQAPSAAPTHTVPTIPQATPAPCAAPAALETAPVCSPSPQFHSLLSSALYTSNQVPAADGNFLPGAPTPHAGSAGTRLGVFEPNGLLPTLDTSAFNGGASIADPLPAAHLNYMVQNESYAKTKAPSGVQRPLFFPER
ncbi:hypothetical protein FRC07_003037 [Ceratobasidium sp. 392]|nr:hypothetical protein FRC07_003037 [Ceratobasidium sp. 392]